MENCNSNQNTENINMKSFLAKIVFNICIDAGENKNQFDEQVRFINATNKEDAFFKAKLIGKKEETVFVNDNGKTVHWKFS